MAQAIEQLRREVIVSTFAVVRYPQTEVEEIVEGDGFAAIGTDEARPSAAVEDGIGGGLAYGEPPSDVPNAKAGGAVTPFGR